MGTPRYQAAGPSLDRSKGPDLWPVAGTGEIGEVRLYGQRILTCYANQPEFTDDILRHGWLFTGDLARWNKAGRLQIVDRKRDIFKVQGEVVYPSEIESVLTEDPAISEAAVSQIAIGKEEERVVVFVLCNESIVQEDSLIDRLRALVRERLGPRKVPQEIVVVDEMRRATNDKIVKQTLIDKWMASE